jgi:cytochrome c oxidase subunit 2
MDVIHSFFLPNIRLKQDAVPGLTIPQWFQAVKTTAQARKERKERGDPGADEFQFEIACAELCGIQHTSMRGTLVVHEEADFLAWLDGEYVAKVHEYGTNPDALINRHWPATENRIEDSWTRDRWPADLKAKWPRK